MLPPVTMINTGAARPRGRGHDHPFAVADADDEAPFDHAGDDGDPMGLGKQ